MSSNNLYQPGIGKQQKGGGPPTKKKMKIYREKMERMKREQEGRE